jgi:hypothetical protein
MRGIITTAAAVILAGGAYFAGSAVTHAGDARSQHRLMAAVVTGKTVGIDSGTYSCQPVSSDAGVYVLRSGRWVWMAS